MADIWYGERAAIDPTTVRPMNNVDVQFYAPTDTAFTAPLTVKDSSGVATTSVHVQNYILPGFYGPDTGVVARSGNWITPLNGDSGAQALAQAEAAVAAAASATATAESFAGQITGVGTAVKQVAVNVMDFGAVGNGTTNDSAAFQSAMDFLNVLGGGTLIVPGGRSYPVANPATVLHDNIEVRAYGATLVKLSGASGSAFVANTADGSEGYGGGLKNFTWRGGRFLGNFAGSVHMSSFGLHQAQNCVFEDITFEQCQSGVGHVFDLGAGDQITIRRCTFLGQNTNGTSDQAEAINVDGSYFGTLSSGEANTGFSGLMTRNLTVEKCQFLPLTVSSTTYPGPNPLGTHFNVEGKQYVNIRFLDNLVVDPRENPPASTADDSDDDFYAGAVHMGQVRGFYVQNNTFQMTQNYRTRAITCMSKKSGVLASSLPTATTATRGTFTNPAISEDVYITGNTFIGFHTTGAVEALDVVYVRGVTATGGNVKNVHINGNTFKDGYNSAATVQKGAISLQQVTSVEVSNNTVDSSYYGVNVNTATGLRVTGNQFRSCSNFPAFVNTVNGGTINGNSAESCGGPFQVNSTGNTVLAITGNTFRAPTGTGNAANGIVVVGGAGITVISNTVINDTGTTQTRGIVVGASATNTVVSSNMVTGYTTKISGAPTGDYDSGRNVSTAGNF